MYGNPETTTGGRALKFYSSIRMEVRKSENIKEGANIIGNKVNVKVSKNKVAPPFKSTTVEIYYGQGISHLSEIVELGVTFGLIEKAGSWFSYKGEKIGQGSQSVRQYLKDNPAVDEELTQAIREKMFAQDAAE